MKQCVFLFLFLAILSACKKDEDHHSSGIPADSGDTATFSIDINGGLMFPDSVHATLSIDTITYPRPARWYRLFVSEYLETLKVGFIDTSWGNGIPIKTFVYTGDSVSAWFDYSRINSQDTIEHCSIISGTFQITSSDSLEKEISATFEAVLLDTVSGDTIYVEGNFGNFWYDIQ